MKEKSFKRLSRMELVEIIYRLQLDMQKLQEENALLKEKLEKKELKISEAGSIAQAVAGLTEIFEKAQETADYYLDEVRKNCGIEESKEKNAAAGEEETEEYTEENAENNTEENTEGNTEQSAEKSHKKKKRKRKSALKQRKKSQ